MDVIDKMFESHYNTKESYALGLDMANYLVMAVGPVMYEDFPFRPYRAESSFFEGIRLSILSDADPLTD